MECEVCGEEIPDGDEEVCRDCNKTICIDCAIPQEESATAGGLIYCCEPCDGKRS